MIASELFQQTLKPARHAMLPKKTNFTTVKSVQSATVKLWTQKPAPFATLGAPINTQMTPLPVKIAPRQPTVPNAKLLAENAHNVLQISNSTILTIALLVKDKE